MEEKRLRLDRIANSELQELLKTFPDDAIVCIEYCDIRSMKYIPESNILEID